MKIRISLLFANCLGKLRGIPPHTGAMELEATERSPAIVLDTKKGKLSITGRSVHEDADELFSPLQIAVEDHLKEQDATLEATFYVEYFNTSSSKYFLDLMKAMEDAFLSHGAQVRVTWCHDKDDQDMKEAGEDYERLLQIPVIVVAEDPSRH